MKSTTLCVLAILALQQTTVSCSNPSRHLKRRKSPDWAPQTPISMVPVPDETDRLKEALELLNMGKKALGLGTEPPEALLEMAASPNDKAKSEGINQILKKPSTKDQASMGKQILVLSGQDRGKMSVQNFVNSTLSPREEMAVRAGGKVQDFFKMEMEKRTPVEHGDVYHKITIMQSNKEGPYNSPVKSRRKRFRRRRTPLWERRGRNKREGGMVVGPSEDGHKEVGFGRTNVVADQTSHGGGGFWSKIRNFFAFLKPVEKAVTEKPWSAVVPSFYGGEVRRGIEDKQSGGYINGKSLLNYTASTIQAPFGENDTQSQNRKLNDSMPIAGIRENHFMLQENVSNHKTPMVEENPNKNRGTVQRKKIVLTSDIDSSMSTQNPDSETEIKMLKRHSSSLEIFPADISKRKSRSKDNGPVEKVPVVSLDVMRQAEYQGGRFPYQRENWHENQLYFSGLIGACMMFLVLVCIVTGVIVFRKIDRRDQDFSAGNLNLKGKHLILKLSGEDDVLNDDFIFKEPREMVHKRPFYSNYWKRGRYIPLHNEEEDFDFAGLDWQSEMGEWLSDGELSSK